MARFRIKKNEPECNSRMGPDFMDTVTINSLWKQACEHLRDALHADVYSRWIAVISPVRVEEDTSFSLSITIFTSPGSKSITCR
jgi:hypothetical protein